jgi:hypothetical protein
MVRIVVFPVIAKCDTYEELHSLLDGTPCVFALPVRTWLDNDFRDRWIGRRGQKEWLSCDFFLWDLTN